MRYETVFVRKLWIYFNTIYFNAEISFFFFPRAASLFESVRKAKKETKLEVWVQTAVSTGSTTYRLKQDQ